jgi:hypothetical protein
MTEADVVAFEEAGLELCGGIHKRCERELAETT